MKISTLIIIVFVLISCRKDNYGSPLKGEKEYFIGEWELESSLYFNFCDSINGTVFLTAEEQEITYRILIEETGFISFYQGDSLLDGGYAVFPGGGFDVIPTGTVLDPKIIHFTIWLDGNRYRKFAGVGSQDSMRTSIPRIGFEPYVVGNCELYHDYFKRK